jgi:hypothetical protein
VILFSFFLYSNYQNTQYISLVCANYLSSYNITYVFLFGTTICYRTAKILFTYNFNTATIQTNNFLFVAHEKYCSSKYSRDDSDVKHRTFFLSYLRHIKCARPCRETKKAYCFRRDRFRQYTLSKLGIVRRRDRNETLRYI